MNAEPRLQELVAIFAQSEVEQGRYFPQWDPPVWVEGGTFQAETRYARFAAILVLASRAKHAETSADAELAQLGTEIAALANMLIETSSIWDWLMWHPRDICVDESAMIVVDPTLYEIWSVLRRLCSEAAARFDAPVTPRPFAEVFAKYIKTA